jgi:hypothetical protein
MADWEYIPATPARIDRAAPKTLITRFEDGRELRRQKHSWSPRTITHKYSTRAEQFSDMIAFAESKGLNTTFTMLSFDPKAIDPDTDAATVRFLAFPSTAEVAVRVYHHTWRFLEVNA